MDFYGRRFRGPTPTISGPMEGEPTAALRRGPPRTFWVQLRQERGELGLKLLCSGYKWLCCCRVGSVWPLAVHSGQDGGDLTRW